MPYTDFHFTPTGTGVISGKEVLEQTEDAINDLGTQISGDVQTAIDTANNALNTANTASADAQNAVNTANTAYTAATNAQNTANTAQTTATNAQNAATAAQNDVDALENVVTGIEGRLTTTEGNVTNLTTRMGTAEGNITTLQNDVVTAQGTATSAQNTATLARGQAYVVRYASVAVSDNSTVPYTDLNNTDNIKANDLLLDTNGKLYQISSVDTSNETVSVTTPLTQLALDANVMHLSGNETANGVKTFSSIGLTGYPSIRMYLTDDEWDVQPATVRQSELRFTDKNSVTVSYFVFQHRTDINEPFRTCWRQQKMDGTSSYFSVVFNNLGDFYPEKNNSIALGRPAYKWKDVQTNLVNGLTPSSLSLPATTGTVDISGYVTDLTGNTVNTYSPVANGYIVITCNANDVDYIKMSNNLDFVSVIDNTNNQFTSGILGVWQPCIAGIGVQIRIKSSALKSAKFIPCQGNV